MQKEIITRQLSKRYSKCAFKIMLIIGFLISIFLRKKTLSFSKFELICTPLIISNIWAILNCSKIIQSKSNQIIYYIHIKV